MQGLEKNAEPHVLTNGLFWCKPSCSMPCHQPSPPAVGSCSPRGGSISSPPVIPSREVWLAGGRGCPCSSGEITEISPCHSSAFLPGKEGSTGSAGVRGDKLGAKRLCWSAVDPCLLQICLSGLGPALLLNAERHVFMRDRSFSPPACPTALAGLWGILSPVLLSLGEASKVGSVYQGRCKLSQKESREDVKRAPV